MYRRNNDESCNRQFIITGIFYALVIIMLYRAYRNRDTDNSNSHHSLRHDEL
jgi:hypothetical protein